MLKLGHRNVPVNLRQSGDPGIQMVIGTRVEKSPFFHKSIEHGVRAVTVYNHMYHPRLYFAPDQGGLLGEYEYLTRHVTLWNVAVERQVRVKGPDAQQFVNFVTTRKLGDEKLPVNKARYVILCNEAGGIINDPVLLRVAEDEYWFSISDSDVMLWFQGLLCGMDFDARADTIDVAPVQIQGPKAMPLMKSLFGEAIDDIPYYGLWQTSLDGMEVVISRTGFSGEIGYEVYLREATEHADRLWDTIMAAGEPFNIRVIAPGHIRRIEAGILSYNQDMDLETNPFEVGLDRLVDLDKENYIGREALARIHAEGVSRKLVGIVMGGHDIRWYNSDFWLVYRPGEHGEPVGYVTSAFYSPKLDRNIGLAMVPVELSEPGTPLEVDLPSAAAGEYTEAEVHPTPFVDPNKEIPTGRSHG